MDNRSLVRIPRASTLVLGLFVVLAFNGREAAGQEKENRPTEVWIYKNMPTDEEKDARTDTESMFAPYGFMPKERVNQIAVNARRLVNRKDPKEGTCIEYAFKFVDKQSDWQGVYTLVGGDAWGTKPGANIQKLLKLDDAAVECRFRARGELGGEVVTFQCGGVNTGPHKSSLRFPVTTKTDPVRLTKDFQEYSIPLKAGDLTNVVDPFCVVARAADNREKNSITILVDDIRFLVPKKGRKEGRLPADWRERLTGTLFVAYTPTGFDPTARPPAKPSPDDIRADLAAIRALADKSGIKGTQAGIITYGCSQGLEEIAPLAKEADLSMILGIFNPRDETEVKNAERLLAQEDLDETIVACCVGNEPLTFRRASLEEIRQVAERLRNVRNLPLTTTEIIQSYGNRELFKAPFTFTFCNAHAIFAEIRDAGRGAEWAVERLKDLVDTAPEDHIILAKELGWPGGPEPFDRKQQAAYWKRVLSDPVARRVNVCIFDGLKNVPWKNEMIAVGGDKVNIGSHWAVLFDADRKPTAVAEEVLKGWQKSRGR